MDTAEVLVIVDVEGALANNDLQNNVYLVDNQKYMGSWQEGQCELVTACHDTQKIKWRVTAISPDDDVAINSFSGQMINNRYCVPKQEGTGDDVYWEGTVESQDNRGQYQYSMTLSMSGKNLTFDPFIQIS
ncbi:MAG TPA: hypothetical protein VK469_16405 [Candidatus Kapabacteria bacterium]|nr:hypothetical protein [Candidatus Kapabacteria bacterium]